MDIDLLFAALNDHNVRFLLIGGMNFVLRHEPVSTYDIDLWIEDTEPNRRACESALAVIDAEWGRTEEDWGPVAAKASGWMGSQAVYCLTSRAGAVDVFLNLSGLSDWSSAFARSVAGRTDAGQAYRGLSDEDMLACQLALATSQQKKHRIEYLRKRLQNDKGRA